MAVQLGMSVDGVDDVLRRFAELPVGLQKKYLRAAVNKVTKPYIQPVKDLVPRGPTGNLRRSVGVLTEAKVRGKTQTAVLGFRRSGKNKSQLGYHAWWIEKGVKSRRSKSGSMLRVPADMAKRYKYLMGKIKYDDAAFFPSVQGFAGTGKFEAWADATLPRIRTELEKELVSAVDKAIAENARRQQRKAEGKG